MFESWMQTCFSSFLNIQPTAFYSEQVALRQTAWKTLSQLTLLLLVFEEKEDSSLSKTFDHSIRALAGGEASLENAQFFATSSQMAQLLSVLVRRIAPQLLPNRWHFLFQRLSNWIVVPFPFFWFFDYPRYPPQPPFFCSFSPCRAARKALAPLKGGSFSFIPWSFSARSGRSPRNRPRWRRGVFCPARQRSFQSGRSARRPALTPSWRFSPGFRGHHTTSGTRTTF